jgi:hypothetical protein
MTGLKRVYRIATTDDQVGGDVSPEGVQAPARRDPGTPNALLVVSCEESGSTRIFELKRN